MPEIHEEPVVVTEHELHTLEASLEKLWEKARRVSEVLLRLQGENKDLRIRLREHEMQAAQLKDDLRTREHDLERMRSELLGLQSNGSQAFSREEKEELQQKIKELIAKINARV